MTLIHGFELLQEQEIPELNTRARLFRHQKTGAELLSLENSDENKVFGITFRTPPADSTGVPHIMEHSVLCGSRKYPLKEPFVELMKGSLNTFLNAFTYPDKTCYPVASQNLQDFYNLIDVYMDAVLYPLIPPHTLQQEGWHYELDDPDAPLAFKGVVFNEMKGAYSSPDNVLARLSQQSLYPDITYGVDSGGDPRVIPDLTYAQFKGFHETYYHPSNSRIFFYGDDNPEERLRRMDEWLAEFEPIQPASEVGLQPRFAQPQRRVEPYDASEEEDGSSKALLTVNWLLPDTSDPQTTLGLGILSHILIGTPASPLRKALIDSGLGEDLTGAGLENELRQMFFSTGLKGMAPADADKVEALILSTLQTLVDQGIDGDTVAASLNTTEFRLRENNTGAFPRGLLLMLRSLTTWLHGGDPLAPLAFAAPLAAIQAAVANGERYFEGLIAQHLLANPHRTTVILEPDPGLRQRQEAAERERLDQARAAMSAAELFQVVEDTRLLKERQETPDSPEALATIPTLRLADLDRHNKTIPLEVLEGDGHQILYHDLPTNGIVYLDLGFDLYALPQEFLPYVTLFGRSLLEMGAAGEDFVKLSQRIGRSTGGIYPTPFTTTLRDSGKAAAWLFLRAKSTTAKADEMLAILRDVLLTARLDNRERFRQMVLEEKADQEAGLVPSGHRVVNTRLRGLFNAAGWAAEQIGGLEYLFFLRKLAAEIDTGWPAVLAKLEAIRAALLKRSNLIANVTLDQDNWTRFQPQLAGFLSGLPAGAARRVEWTFGADTRPQGLTIPAQVNYVGKGADLYAAGYQLDGSQAVITNYLRTTWLWERVRVQGGAYGGFCLFDTRSGVFTFLSYRDPNLLATLQNYDGAGGFLRRLELSDEELTKSIIGAIGDMDAYQLPDAKGFTSLTRYLAGESDEFRQRLRAQVLDTTLADFHAFGELLDQVKDQAYVVVLGSQEDIEAANRENPGWLSVEKVL